MGRWQAVLLPTYLIGCSLVSSGSQKLGNQLSESPEMKGSVLLGFRFGWNCPMAAMSGRLYLKQEPFLSLHLHKVRNVRNFVLNCSESTSGEVVILHEKKNLTVLYNLFGKQFEW